MARIQVDSLTKSFGAFAAVKDVTFDISEGEFVALLGPSGCGKTTTMNMLAGLEQPTSGMIQFSGQDVTNVSAKDRNIGFVFQNYAIFMHMTVRENISFGLLMRRHSKTNIQKKVADISTLLGLNDLLEQSPRGMSVNVLQRIAIARSAVMEPKIFLLDEPLSNLDSALRAEMRIELRKLQRRLGQTLVYVTHDQIEAMSMADRIAVMDGGELQQYGTPLEVYNDPNNVFVAKFIGSPGMNVLPARIEANGNEINVMIDGIHALPLPLGLKSPQNDVQIGVRAEDVQFSSANDSSLSGTVKYVERNGPQNLLHVECRNISVKVVAPTGHHFVLNEKVGLEFSSPVMKVFDSAGTRIREAA